MSDFHLKFIQCHGCNGYGKYEDMEYDYIKRAFCTKECKNEGGKTVFGYTPHRLNEGEKINKTKFS